MLLFFMNYSKRKWINQLSSHVWIKVQKLKAYCGFFENENKKVLQYNLFKIFKLSFKLFKIYKI